MRRRYRAYGLEIDTALVLPELSPGDPELRADVTIDAGLESTPDSNRYQLQLGLGEAVFQNAHLTMSVREGRRICVNAVDPDAPAVRQYVVGPGLALVLLQRRLPLLHASAVILRGRAYAFAADSGGGKSTLAGALHARGHSLLTDDVCLVENGSIVPAFPLLKLAEPALRWLHAPGPRLDIEMEGDRRLRFHAPGLATASAPLAAVFVLEEGEDVRVEALRGSDAVMHFVRAMYWHDLATGEGRGLLFRQAAALAATIPIFRLIRPLSWERLDGVCDAVETVEIPD